jgi:hypothetical protein
MKSARLALHQQQRQERDDVCQRRVKDRVGEPLRPEPGRDVPRLAVRQLAVDRVGGDDGRVHEQPQRDDQRGDRDLLQVDPDHLRQAQGERDRHGMETATSRALRHSMNTSDTSTTITIASIRFGSKLVDLVADLLRLVARALQRRSGGRICLRSAMAALRSRS